MTGHQSEVLQCQLDGMDVPISTEDLVMPLRQYTDYLRMYRMVGGFEQWHSMLERGFGSADTGMASVPLTELMQDTVEQTSMPNFVSSTLRVAQLSCHCDEAFVDELGSLIPRGLRTGDPERTALCGYLGQS